MFVTRVIGIMNITSGKREYEDAMNISLNVPSPSKSVVKHQLPTHQSMRGTNTVSKTFIILIPVLSGLNI